MVRLVQSLRPDLLKETHQFLAQTLEIEGSMREAERHYVEAQEWHSAVNMYRSNEMWDDAFRVAKFYGGISACKRVTIALLMAVGVLEGSKTLVKHGLVEAAIEHDFAFDLLRSCELRSTPAGFGISARRSHLRQDQADGNPAPAFHPRFDKSLVRPDPLADPPHRRPRGFAEFEAEFSNQ